MVGILLIATRKYTQFVEPLIHCIDKLFLIKHDIVIHLFTDKEIELNYFDRVSVVQHKIPSYGFPEATLLRYKIFSQQGTDLQHSDFIYYMDVDMRIEKEIGEEIFGDLTAVYHPGYFKDKGWGSPHTDYRSLAYILPEHRKEYFAGGFQGGETFKYLTVCSRLSQNIETDKVWNVQADWHDETHWNSFLNYGHPKDYPSWKITKLDPSYCMVEQMILRESWGIAHLDSKIVALAKNHKELRS